MGMLGTSLKAIAMKYKKRAGFINDILGLFPVNPLVIRFPDVHYGVRGFKNASYVA